MGDQLKVNRTFRGVGLLCVCLALVGTAGAAWAGTMYLSDVPEYDWFHGCSPTSGAMLIGYWDSKPGYENLFFGDASYDWGASDGSTGTKRMISSKEHNTGTFSYPTDTHTDSPNSLACFMRTNPTTGSTYGQDVFSGLRDYAYWDDPKGILKDSYSFYANWLLAYNQQWMPAEYQPSCMSFDFLEKQIDLGLPMLLNLSLDGAGHTVVAYGYQDNGPGNQWYAVRDTWLDGDSSGVYGVISKTEGGIEWWKWREAPLGSVFGNTYYVDQGVIFGPESDGWVTEAALNETFATAQTLPRSQVTVSGSVSSATDGDWYSLYLAPGDLVLASTSDLLGGTRGVDTLVQLWDPAGTLAAEDDDQYATRKSHLQYRVADTDPAGLWRLRVSGMYGSTGSYRLAVNSFASMAMADIPEPSTVALFGVCLVGLALIRRRRAA
jgi:hypothetical protein